MPERKLSLERENAIIRLLDDDSPLVRAVLLAELRRLDETGLILLKKVVRSRNRLLASFARDCLEQLQGPEPAEEFQRFIRSLSYELESGCALLSRVVFPHHEPAEDCLRLDAMAARCRELIVRPASPREQCLAFNRVLFHEYGFRGDVESSDDPLNSFLCQTIQRRKGSPLTLSIIYLLVARRNGLDLEPIAVPGRFHVGCFHGEEPFYVDLFERGAIRSREYLREVVVNQGIVPHEHYFLPVSTGEVLCLCCCRLARQYSLKNNPAKARLFASLVREFESALQRQAQS